MNNLKPSVNWGDVIDSTIFLYFAGEVLALGFVFITEVVID